MATFHKIASVTADGSSSSIMFSSIPQTFTDLSIFLSGRSTNSQTYCYVRLKINGTAYTSAVNIYSDPTWQAGSDTSALFVINGGTSTANCFSSNSIYIPNYQSTSAKVTSTDTVWEQNNASVLMNLLATKTTSSTAITTLEIYTDDVSNFAQFSSATLYGISKI